MTRKCHVRFGGEDEETHLLKSKKVRLVLTLHPGEFCEPGYELARTLEVWNAGDFPADVILYPDQEFQEVDTEPDEGPLIEHYENASRLGDDNWLESAFEDSISGWDE